ncbi:MAG: hypothetical protein QF516_01700, partial [Pirellulaceae bacterium]|nr:hypothetical protein [Pirellulaceae bacterium]
IARTRLLAKIPWRRHGSKTYGGSNFASCSVANRLDRGGIECVLPAAKPTRADDVAGEHPVGAK